MFDQHLYDKGFFTFVSEIITYCSVEEVADNVLIVENAEELTQKDISLYTFLYEFIAKHIFKLLVYAYHNDSLMMMRDTLMNIFSLHPPTAASFLQNFVWGPSKDSFENFWTLLLKSSDAKVRTAISQIHGFKLDITVTAAKTAEERAASEALNLECELVEFLDKLFNLLGKEVAENWMKFKEYFDVTFLLSDLLVLENVRRLLGDGIDHFLPLPEGLHCLLHRRLSLGQHAPENAAQEKEDQKAAIFEENHRFQLAAERPLEPYFRSEKGDESVAQNGRFLLFF